MRKWAWLRCHLWVWQNYAIHQEVYFVEKNTVKVSNTWHKYKPFGEEAPNVSTCSNVLLVVIATNFDIDSLLKGQQSRPRDAEALLRVGLGLLVVGARLILLMVDQRLIFTHLLLPRCVSVNQSLHLILERWAGGDDPKDQGEIGDGTIEDQASSAVHLVEGELQADPSQQAEDQEGKLDTLHFQGDLVSCSCFKVLKLTDYFFSYLWPGKWKFLVERDVDNLVPPNLQLRIPQIKKRVSPIPSFLLSLQQNFRFKSFKTIIVVT